MTRVPSEDAKWIRDTCGQEVLDRLLDQGWDDLRLHRPLWSAPGDSYTGAVLFALLVSPPPRLIVVKVMAAGAPSAEVEAHERALAAEPDFARRHLVGLPHPAGERLSDGRSVMYQNVAAGSLRDVVPAKSLEYGELSRVAEEVVTGLFSDWNRAALAQAVPQATTLTAFLGRELDDVWRVGGSLLAFAGELGVLPALSPWLFSDGLPLPNPYHLVEGGWPGDPVVPVLRGLGHGDLHLDNILVPRREKDIRPEEYRLIDLCTFSADTNLGRDVATLLLSSLVPYVDYELPPDQRRALLRYVVDPDVAHRAHIVPVAVQAVQAVRETARRQMSDWGDPFDVQLLLSLVAGALRFTTYTGITRAGRTFFARLAAHAAGEVLARTWQGAAVQPPAVFPHDSFRLAGFRQPVPATVFVPDELPQRVRWRTETGLRDDRAVVGFGPGHTVVVVDGQGGVRRWTVHGEPLNGTGGRTPRIRLGHQALVASLTPSVVVASPGELHIVHFVEDDGVLRPPPVPLRDGDHFLVTSGGDVFATHDRRRLTVRRFEDGAPIEALACPPGLAASALSTDGSVIAMARSREVFIHRRGRESLRTSMAKPVANSLPRMRSALLRAVLPSPGLQLAVAPSGSHVGAVTFEEAVVWRTEDGREVYRRALTNREAVDALGATGMRLVCTEAGTLFWLHRGRLSVPTANGGTQVQQSGTGSDVAISRDGKLMALLSREGRLEVWDL
ncbi:hypothetical protein ACWEPR_24400 [Streptomyces sp. NPDC004290]